MNPFLLIDMYPDAFFRHACLMFECVYFHYFIDEFRKQLEEVFQNLAIRERFEIRMHTLLIKYARSAIHVACDDFLTSSEVRCFCTSKLDIFSTSNMARRRGDGQHAANFNSFRATRSYPVLTAARVLLVGHSWSREFSTSSCPTLRCDSSRQRRRR